MQWKFLIAVEKGRIDMAFDSMLQRQIMGRFATGVTVVTTKLDGQVSGMTANAVISLSLNPAIVAVSVDKSASMHQQISDGGCFAINILNVKQEEISNRFAKPGPKDFSDLNIEKSLSGAPIINGVIAWLDCILIKTVPVGDHDLFLGEPIAGSVNEGAPLIYFGSRYDSLVEGKVKDQD